MRYTFLLGIFFPFLASSQSFPITPQPVESKITKGKFIINSATTIVLGDADQQATADFFNDYLHRYYGFTLKTAKEAKSNYIKLSVKNFILPPDKDGYSMEITPKSVDVSGDTYTGTFYGIQSILQLLPLQKKKILEIPCGNITDYPRFKYRGLHLDVSRHFFPVEFIKKYIDFIAWHKMNYFHWHLTDDQGWRIEIKQYPALTQIGAWRNGTIIGRYPGEGNDHLRYGGYYTQEQIKEVVQYAAKRHITIIPEIEMPGHSSAAIAAYPFLSCFPNEPTIKYFPNNSSWSGDTTGKQVEQTWGVFSDVYCAGKDSTFDFLENVLTEVIALFPSTYIHIGGDECPKENWNRCPLCLKRMQKKGLKDAHELQSYFIQRIEKFLNSKGRKIIGWDEILEGGLAPNATVMSWRGINGGIAAAQQQHDVIMTPGNPVYFDHSQSENEDSVTIGGYNPIEAVYNYEPVPTELNEKQAAYILGAQANLWTEYMTNPLKVEYMLFPRLSALSEVLWSPSQKRNWNDFEKKIPKLFQWYDFMKVNYSKAYYDINGKVQATANHTALSWELKSKVKKAVIHYSLGGNKLEQVYKQPILINQSQLLTANLIVQGKKVSTLKQSFYFNKATAKNITLLQPASSQYAGNGPLTLVDGIVNEKGLQKAKEFLGFEGKNCEAIIDLGKVMTIKDVSAHILEDNERWIYRPASIEAYVSEDGNTYQFAGKSDMFMLSYPLRKVSAPFAPTQARYVKIIIKNFGTIPAGKAGGGHPAWLFVDEIEVN